MNYRAQQPWLPFSEVQWDWDLSFHDLMLGDELRMRRYKAAIDAVVRPGDRVLDLGTGTGILSQWALAAGAECVYGVDVDPAILSLAVDRVNAAGFGARFVPINKVSFDVILPEQVDVIISEIMGNLGDNEGFQTILEDAHARFLKPRGRSIPRRVETHLVPVSAERAHARVAARDIATLNSHYNVEQLLDDRQLTSVFNLYYDAIIPRSAYLSAPQSVKVYEGGWRQSSTYSKYLNYEVQRPGALTGFKGYFIAELSESVSLDISGDDIAGRTTSDSWKHAYLPIAEPIPVVPGDRVAITYTRSNPTVNPGLEQVYRWSGVVSRDGRAIAQFDQCLDEHLLDQESLPSIAIY